MRPQEKLFVGLGLVGLGWVGLGWVGLGWVGLGWGFPASRHQREFLSIATKSYDMIFVFPPKRDAIAAVTSHVTERPPLRRAKMVHCGRYRTPSKKQGIKKGRLVVTGL